MNKFYGIIGYCKNIETSPGVWEETYIEKSYYGDIMRNSTSHTPSQYINDNITINNSISIVADPYANENFQHMRYVKWMNCYWKISSVEVNYPRLILSIGGLYEKQ